MRSEKNNGMTRFGLYLLTYSCSSSFAWTNFESRLRYTSKSRSTLFLL